MLNAIINDLIPGVMNLWETGYYFGTNIQLVNLAEIFLGSLVKEKK